jgi:hypothetical protein
LKKHQSRVIPPQSQPVYLLLLFPLTGSLKRQIRDEASFSCRLPGGVYIWMAGS